MTEVGLADRAQSIGQGSTGEVLADAYEPLPLEGVSDLAQVATAAFRELVGAFKAGGMAGDRGRFPMEDCGKIWTSA